MAQNENYSQVDLRVGTEAQFNAKVDTLPAGTLFGVTDATVSKADLSTDLKNEINGKINKPANPSADSAIVISSTGTVSTKVLTDIAGKSEVSVSTATPTGDEILWINPDGTGGGSSSGGGGKLYQHKIEFTNSYDTPKTLFCYFINSVSTPYTSYSQIANLGLYMNIYYRDSSGIAYIGSAIGEGPAALSAAIVGFEHFSFSADNTAYKYPLLIEDSIVDTVTEL